MENSNGVVFYNNYIGKFGDGVSIQDFKDGTVSIPKGFYFENNDLVYLSELERYDEDELVHSPEAYGKLKNQAVEEFYVTLEKYNRNPKKFKSYIKKQAICR